MNKAQYLTELESLTSIEAIYELADQLETDKEVSASEANELTGHFSDRLLEIM